MNYAITTAMRQRGTSGRVRAVCAAAALSLAVWGPAACGQNADPSPFDGVGGEGGAGGAAFDGGLPPLDAGIDATLGGPCVDDGQCDDGIDCTSDTCDLSLERCRFSPDHELCVDDVYCDGREVCEPGLGCREGAPVACSDGTPCTIDVCVESTQTCERSERDADGDGDPVWNCLMGNDCDDSNPHVNGNTLEVCANGRDDDCDLESDEDDCSSPEHDDCSDALVVEVSGSYTLSFAAAKEDERLSCVDPEEGARRDVVIAIVVPEGEVMDVDVVVQSSAAPVALAAVESCAAADVEIACHPGAPQEDGGSVARLILRELAPGAYPVFVSSTGEREAQLDVRYGPALPLPTHETCGTARVLTEGVNEQVSLAAAVRDVGTECEDRGGDVFYSFDLAATQDVELHAVSLDGYGSPALSLRDMACTRSNAELACRSSSPATLFARALPAGSYFVGLSASGPTDVDLRLEVSPPSAAPPEEGCGAPPAILLGEIVEVELEQHVDAVRTPCSIGAPDAAFALVVEEPMDLLLVERIAAGDRGAVSLFPPSCRRDASLVCESQRSSPVRARALNVPAGEYRVVAESEQGAPVTLSVLGRPARPATLVAFADGCEDAVTIPEQGGRFVGNTANALSDFSASCDSAFSNGAPEQMLRLDLSERRRVVLDLGASDYETLLAVRRGGECPGAEVENACAPGYVEGRSYLDVTLDAGEYRVQIDGFDGDSGAWVLDVFVSAP